VWNYLTFLPSEVTKRSIVFTSVSVCVCPRNNWKTADQKLR